MLHQLPAGRLHVIWAAILAAGSGLLVPAFIFTAGAETLDVGSDAALWMRLGADVLLWLHIGGGTLGILSGFVAIFSRKGAPIHRAAGKVFFASMFIAYLIGAGVAPFLETGQRPNFVAGVLALYLLITAWLAARRRNPKSGMLEFSGLVVALLVTAAGGLFAWQGAQDPTGTVDGAPPQAFVLFVVVGSLAALGDFHVLLRRRINGTMRIARHLWRMCVSFFIAAASFFFGQQQLLPDHMLGTPLQSGPVLAPLVALVVWLVWIRLPGWGRPKPSPQTPFR